MTTPRSGFVLLFIALLGVAAEGARGQATRPAAFDALAAKLGSPDPKERDAAQAGIVALGDDAVKAAEELAEKAEDAEVRARARSVVRQITLRSVRRPALVTLHYIQAPASLVYADLLKQAGGNVELSPEDLFDEAKGQRRGDRAIPRVTIDVKNVPFWTAVLELAKQTGVVVGQTGGSMRFERDERALQEWATFVSGPFLVAADRRRGNAVHELTVYVEPRLQVLGHAPSPVILESNPVHGPLMLGAMPPQGPGEMVSPPFGGNSFDLRLASPVRANSGRFKGTVRVAVTAERGVIEIGDLANANNAERHVDGRRFVLNLMNPEPGEWFLMLAAYDAGAAPAAFGVVSAGIGSSETSLELLDATGKRLTSGGQGMNGGGRRTVFNSAFTQGPNVGAPAKLRLTFPANLREIDVPFEFEFGGAAPIAN